MIRSASKILMAALLVTAWLARPVQAAQLPPQFPRLGNIFLSPTLTTEQATDLARWDVVTLGIENQYTNPEQLDLMRQINPNIIMLAYITAEEIPTKHLAISDSRHPLFQLIQGIPDSWWLMDTSGNRTGFWPGSDMVNVTDLAPTVNGQRWNTYLPTYLHEHVMSTGLWDGIFYDNIFPTVSWVNAGNLDLDQNGQTESAATMDIDWHDGMAKMLNLSRQLEGPNSLIIGNGSGTFYPTLNGRLMEEFPSLMDGDWPGAMNVYFDVSGRGLSPAMVIVNGTAKDQATSIKHMRYVFTSTLLGNGFFSFDMGSSKHADVWTYDEFQVYLGLPLNTAHNLSNPQSWRFQTGVWRRDFQNGAVLVNSTSQSQTVTVGPGYATIAGTQDPAVNTGKKVSRVTLAPHDGIILLKERVTLQRGQQVNGGLTTILSSKGKVLQQGFVNESAFPLQSILTAADLNRDGSTETVTVNGPTISIFHASGQRRNSFVPFPSRLKDGLTLAVGNVTGDRQLEIIVATRSGQPTVCLYSNQGKKISCWLAYHPNAREGVIVATGNFSGRGYDSIVTAKRTGPSPAVRIYTDRGQLQKGFSLVKHRSSTEWSMASGDLNGDRKAEIVIGEKGRTNVRVVNRAGQSVRGFELNMSQALATGSIISLSEKTYAGRPRLLISTPLSL